MTPERTALAKAIERHREAADRVRRLTDALPRARDASVAAFVAVEKAEAVLAEARADAPHGYVAALLGATAPPRDTIALAERALAGATAHNALAHNGEDRLKADLASAESRLALTRMSLDAAIRAVVRPSPELAALLTDYDMACARVAALAGALRALARRDCLPAGAVVNEISLVSPLRPLPPVPAPPWDEVLAALEADAAAPLPR